MFSDNQIEHNSKQNDLGIILGHLSYIYIDFSINLNNLFQL